MASATCYRPTNGTVGALGEVPLCTNFISKNGFAPCCFDGDTCLEGNVCYRSDPLPGSKGYYIALCNDKNFQDPSCSLECTSYGKGDLVWSASENTWLCCGTDAQGNPNCDHPTSEKVDALPQSVILSATVSISSSTTSLSTSATVSATASTTPTMSATNSAGSITTSTSPSSDNQINSESSSSGLSTGAKAGVGVGAAAGAILLSAIFAWFFMRRSRRAHGNPAGFDVYKQQSMAETPSHNPYTSEAPAYSPGENDTYAGINGARGAATNDAKFHSSKQERNTVELDSAPPLRHSHIHEMS